MELFNYIIDAASVNGRPPFRVCVRDVSSAAVAKKRARAEYEKRNGIYSAKSVVFYATRSIR